MTWTLTTPLNLPDLERDVIAHWTDRDVPGRFKTFREGSPRWVTYEGPPTVNGNPALHHVWTTVYKDVYGRFQTLRGKYVERKAGWDCQGLPIEIAVERELGLHSKHDIEEYGVEKFVTRCEELVAGNIGGFESMLSRVGYWVDYDNPYKTMDESFIESAWSQLKRVSDKGLLYEGEKVVPYCTRCGTGLSSHELGQPGVYQDVTDLSAYVAMPLVGDAAGRELVVWTTTPWTLPMNVAIALDSSQEFAQVDVDGHHYVVLAQLAGDVFPDHEVVAKIAGSELVGREYARPFPEITPGAGASGIVIDWEDTAVDVGTGMVHIASSFGEDDAQLGKRYELGLLNLVGPDGTYTTDAGSLAGTHVGEVESTIIEHLVATDRLVRKQRYKHPYPHCWRCQTRLIYWAKPSWYIRSSSMRDEFVAQNESVTWHPETIKEGRFGNWLRGAVDWSLSRDRYWGTPLPVWKCENGHIAVIGSRAELAERAGRDLGDQRLHRPWIDEVTFACSECDATAHREPAVCDVWLDSGAMPAAQWGFPQVEGSTEKFEANFPADFICEALDQTRGWFYSLLALNTMAFGETPYKNVVCLGLLVDDEGRKMSKSIGNVIDPNDLLPTVGADGIRWYLLSSGAPWGPRRISIDTIGQTVANDIGTLWNVATFWQQYADIAGFAPSGAPAALDAAAVRDLSTLDRWLVSRLESLTAEVTEAFEGYRAHEAAAALAAFIDELSNWYVRRSRRRFWDGNADALATLHMALHRLSLLLSPLVPHVAEMLYQSINGGSESVHLDDWPVADESLRDEALEAQMSLARTAASLGHKIRASEKLGVRQPLRQAMIASTVTLDEDIADVVRDELNIVELDQAGEAGRKVTRRVEPFWKALGPRFRDRMGPLGAAIGALDDAAASTLADGGTVTVDLDGETIEIGPDDVKLVEVPLTGWSSAEEHDVYVAIDTELDDELRHAGAVRNLIRKVQVARRESGLEITDRIWLWVSDEFLGDSELIASEVLAREVASLSSVDADSTGQPGTVVRGEDGDFALLKAAEVSA